MLNLLNKFKFLFDEPDSGSGSGIPSGGDKEDDIKFMGEDDEPEKIDLPKAGKDKELPKIEAKDKKDDEVDDSEEETDDKETKEDESEEDELEALIEDTEEPNDEQLELTTPVRRREILKKYPNLFKDFPYLEKAYYREQQFTELLPTIDDAKKAVEASQILDRFERDILSGNTESILKSVKDSDENAFYKIVDNYMPTLAKIDEKAYHHVLGNTIKHTIIAMLQEARSSKNEALQSAAQILNQFAFGSSDFKPPENLAKDVKPEENSKLNELQKREQAFKQQQFETARGDLNSRVNNSIRATIEANIDPRQSMTDYVRRTAVKEANETLSTMLNSDKRFREIIDRLWDNAFKNNFNKDSVDRIKSAYLSKSKTLLPAVIKKARIEALKGMGKRVTEKVDEETPNKGPIKREKPRSSDSGKTKEIPKGMRTIDFLMQD